MSAYRANPPYRNACRLHKVSVRSGDNKTRLILAKGRGGIVNVFKDAAATTGERHFGQRDQQTAIGHIMYSVHRAVLNKLTHIFGMGPFFGEVDGRRRAVFTAMQFAQPYGLAKMPVAITNYENAVAFILKCDGRHFADIFQHAYAANRWRWQNRTAAAGSLAFIIE